MAYHKREELIWRFVKSEYDIMKLDWESMGYKDVKTCRSSFGHILIQMGTPCFCEQRKNEVYLCKPGKEVPKDPSKSTLKITEEKTRVAWTKGRLKALLDWFIGESDVDVFQILWDEYDYQDPDTCYQSIRNEINTYKLSSRMLVARSGSEIYLVRKVPTVSINIPIVFVEDKKEMTYEITAHN